MSQDDIQRTPKQPEPTQEPASPIGGEATDPSQASTASTRDVTPTDPSTPATEGDPDDTVGTGTSIALGCIAGTLLLIVIGLIFLGILAIL